jgi:mono/diheme cytochrome c family protein
MMLRPALLASTFALALLIIGGGARDAAAAQDQQLVRQGQLLAQSLCADCHSFGGNKRSDRLSPDFAEVGALPSTTALSLRVFLRSSHATMPDIILEPGQIDAISAYILDLGGK